MADNFSATDERASDENPKRAKFDEAVASTKSIGEQAMAAGREFTDRAKELAENSTDTLKSQASDFVDAAKDVASQAGDKLKDAVQDQKVQGAAYVGSLADTMRRAAREFDSDLPIAGTYIRKAAAQVEGVSDTIRHGNFEDLLRNTQSFARRQPTAFLGMAVLAGFGLVRFLNSSPQAEIRTPDGRGGSHQRSANAQGFRNDFSK
jgi:hypothetical protein